jgi:hypothetical protein
MRKEQIMKTISTIVSVLGLIALSAGGAGAVSSTTTSTNSNTALTQQHLTNLQTRGAAQIKLRLTTLNNLSTVISGAKRVTASDKTSLSSEVTTEITGLTSLEAKLAAETTITGAQADVESIYSEFRVYALVDPKVHLVRAADDEQVTETSLSALATKLQTRLASEQTAGKDVSVLETSLTDLKTQVANAQAISSAIETKVLALQPSDYNSDHTILSGDAVQLKTAHSDNMTAYSDAKTIVTGLEALK